MELIGKQIAIETILGQPPELHYPSWYAAQIEKLPPAPPEYLAEQAGILVTNADTISRAKAIEALDKRFDSIPMEQTSEILMLRKDLRNLPSAQPEQIARDIATIIENEQDMRVILKNAERTETHSCDYQRTETHDSRREWYMKGYRDAQPKWTPVSSESMPEDGVTVWVTIKGHDVIRCEDGETLEQAVARISKMRRVSEGFWCEDDKTWYNAGGYPMMVQPIAWMPINTPEPWRGGQE